VAAGKAAGAGALELGRETTHPASITIITAASTALILALRQSDRNDVATDAACYPWRP
jgi:hypothetical protein